MDFSAGICAIRTLIKRENIKNETIECSKLLEKQLENGALKSLQSSSEIEKWISVLFEDGKWEALATGLVLTNDLGSTISDNFFEHVLDIAKKNIEHDEPRLRMVVAHLLGTFAKRDMKIYFSLKDPLFESILDNWNRSPDFQEVNSLSFPPPNFETPPTSPRSPRHRLDDTSGFKSLETSLIAIRKIIQGCGEKFIIEGCLTDEVVDLVVVKSASHINRHVRAVGFHICTALAEISPPEFLNSHSIVNQMVKSISRGLKDNWSQVRFAASVTARTLLCKLDESQREKYLEILLPRMCLNRYYVAEGVRLYSQETWERLMGNNGRDVVAKYIHCVVQYYLECTDSDYEAVREASCHCISELGSKIDKEAVQPYVSTLLHALLTCFSDDSWQVSDAACISSSVIIVAFPTEAFPLMDKIYDLYLGRLSANLWSVRENAATALGNLVRAYGENTLQRIVPVVESFLLMAKGQPPMSQKEYEKKQNDEKVHTGNQVYSCCSLGPRKRKERVDEHPLVKEPWEYSDGAIYMVKELCDVAPEIAVDFFPAIANAAILRHFPQTSHLQQTIWSQLPLMCSSLGKKEFKKHLDLFWDPLAMTLQCGNRLASCAAADCITELCKQIGSTIFHGRLASRPDLLPLMAPFLPVVS